MKSHLMADIIPELQAQGLRGQELVMAARKLRSVRKAQRSKKRKAIKERNLRLGLPEDATEEDRKAYYESKQDELDARHGPEVESVVMQDNGQLICYKYSAIKQQRILLHHSGGRKNCYHYLEAIRKKKAYPEVKKIYLCDHCDHWHLSSLEPGQTYRDDVG